MDALRLQYENLPPEEKEHSFYSYELHILSRLSFEHNCYSQCYVNGVKFLVWERDCKMKTQNSGVMVETDEATYYGVLHNIVELKYGQGMRVLLFKCHWFNTDPNEHGSTIIDHGLLSVDTSTSWYEDSPYCLATIARQVFYLDDLKAGGNWKVVNPVTSRGTYSDSSLARNEIMLEQDEEEPYQENGISHLVVEMDNEDIDDFDDEPFGEAENEQLQEDEVMMDEEIGEHSTSADYGEQSSQYDEESNDEDPCSEEM